jgi:photosystem II stability/assembly factor-like uncharacterized protein
MKRLCLLITGILVLSFPLQAQLKNITQKTIESLVPTQYFSDYSPDFTKKFSMTWASGIATNKDWTGIAISEDGKYVTATAFTSNYIYISSDYGVTWSTAGISGDWERVSMSGDGKYQAAIYYLSGNYGYIYVSSDYGQNWTQKSPYGQHEGVYVSYTGKYMLDGAGTSGYFYISKDYGNTWIDHAPVSGGTWTECAISANGKYVLVGNSGGLVYTSADGGNSWQFHSSTNSWFGAAISYTGQYQAMTSTTDRNVYISCDFGKTWVAQPTNLSTPKTGVTMSLSGKYLMACSYGSAIVYSSDYGQNWSSISQAANFRKVAISGNGTHALGAVNNGYVYNAVPLTTNNTALSYSLPITFGSTTVANFQGDTAASKPYVRERVAAFVEQDPVMKSDITRNIYDTWTSVGSSLTWKTISVSNTTGQYQVAAALGGYIYVSSDYGATWTYNTTPGARDWYWSAISDNGKYMTVVPQSTGYIYTSDDYGVTWTSRDSERSWYSVCMSSTGQYQTAVVRNGYIYVSSDYGVTWTQSGASGPYYGVGMNSTGQYQTAVRMTGYIFNSNDYGATWTQRGSSLSWTAVAMTSSGEKQYAAISGGEIYESTNYGVTWTIKNSTVRSYSDIDVSSDGKIILASVYGDYVYASVDYGATWVKKGTSRNWRRVSMSGNGYRVTGAPAGANLYTTVLSYDFNYYPSISQWANQPELSSMVATKGYVIDKAGINQLSGSLTDGAPTASEIVAITGISAITAGSGYRRYIKDTDGTGLVYLIYSDGNNYFYYVLTQAL